MSKYTKKKSKKTIFFDIIVKIPIPDNPVFFMPTIIICNRCRYIKQKQQTNN